MVSALTGVFQNDTLEDSVIMHTYTDSSNSSSISLFNPMFEPLIDQIRQYTTDSIV